MMKGDEMMKHVAYRGLDVGTCGGEFIKLFVLDNTTEEAVVVG